jgi:hypothetical protein
MLLQSMSSTATTSPTPISPFSSNSVRSEPTSDELPDLGAFTTVFRALNNLHSPRAQHQSATFSFDSDTPQNTSTVWAQRPIASYLTPGSDIASTHSHDSDDLISSDDNPSGSDTEGEPDGRTVEIEDISDIDEADQPSLGYLDEALNFIAAERAKFTAQRDKGAPPVSSENAWRHVIEPRRKRRRRRRVITILHRDPSDGAPADITEATGDADQDGDESSSSFDQSSPANFKSTPTTPARTKKEKKRQRSLLSHSKSTPSLRLSFTVPPDPRVLQLRSLALKLRLLFPEDADALNSILSNDFPDSADFVDPRGPSPQSQDTLIHVFIDQCVPLYSLLFSPHAYTLFLARIS